jgi:hypothetical protein
MLRYKETADDQTVGCPLELGPHLAQVGPPDAFRADAGLPGENNWAERLGLELTIDESTGAIVCGSRRAAHQRPL